MAGLKGRGISIFVVTVVFLVLSLVAVALRCFVRLRLMRAFGWDDALMVFAMALNILFAICGITGPFYGMGQKTEELLQDIPGAEKALFWWWLGQSSYVYTCVAAKAAIAMALFRLTISRLHRSILWGIIGISVLVGLAFWLILTLQCQPVSYFWRRFTATGTCIDVRYVLGVAYLYSVTAVICDFILALLPIVLVSKLQMNFRTKAALAVILGMGCIASTAVIVRIPYLPHYQDEDFLYATANISIWSNVEAGLGITAGSLVTVRPLFRFFRGTGYDQQQSSRTADAWQLAGMNVNADRLPQDIQEVDRIWRVSTGAETGDGISGAVQASSQSRLCTHEDLDTRPDSFHGHKASFKSSNEA